MLSKSEREELRQILRKHLGGQINLDDRPMAYTMLRRSSIVRIAVAATVGNVWLVGLTLGAIYDPRHYLRWARLSFEVAGVMLGIAVVGVFVGVLLTPAEVRRGPWRERRED